MGQDIKQTDFTEDDYRHFATHLYDNLDQLKNALAKEGFGDGPPSLGAELESYIVDSHARPAALNDTILHELNDPQFQPELNRFNLEYNLSPTPAQGTPFTIMGNEIDRALQKSDQVARKHQCQIVAIGILPTLKLSDLQAESMTDLGRYHMLYKGLHKLRGSSFEININGPDPLQTASDHVTMEGANTSLQLHLKVTPDTFADTFNAVQLVTPLAVALAANSPTLLGHRLWQETRIALFKQSIDSRHREEVVWRQPSRVTYGHGWVRHSALELFQETVGLYPPIIPILSKQAGDRQKKFPPDLSELNLHMGTTWPWNRAVYGTGDGGHLRIEMRSLPSGPTVDDMMANAAFLIGTSLGLRSSLHDVLPSMPFRFAEHNFYRAAQCALKADILWPAPGQTCPREYPITKVIQDLLPLMEKGLHELGVTQEEISKYRCLIDNRLQSGMTGARWQRLMLKQYLGKHIPEESYQAMTQQYIRQQKLGKPVAEWSLTP